MYLILSKIVFYLTIFLVPSIVVISTYLAIVTINVEYLAIVTIKLSETVELYMQVHQYNKN